MKVGRRSLDRSILLHIAEGGRRAKGIRLLTEGTLLGEIPRVNSNGRESHPETEIPARQPLAFPRHTGEDDDGRCFFPSSGGCRSRRQEFLNRARRRRQKAAAIAKSCHHSTQRGSLLYSSSLLETPPPPTQKNYVVCMIPPGGGCRLQTCRGLAAQWFDSTLRTSGGLYSCFFYDRRHHFFYPLSMKHHACRLPPGICRCNTSRWYPCATDPRSSGRYRLFSIERGRNPTMGGGGGGIMRRHIPSPICLVVSLCYSPYSSYHSPPAILSRVFVARVPNLELPGRHEHSKKFTPMTMWMLRVA